jgi:hypothetical protein
MYRKIWKAELHAGHGKGHLSAIAEEKWNTQGMYPYCGTVNAGVENLNFSPNWISFLLLGAKHFFTFSVYFLSELERVGHFFCLCRPFCIFIQNTKCCHT